jgi:hypothetical protein
VSLISVLPKFTSDEGHAQTRFLLLPWCTIKLFTWRLTYDYFYQRHRFSRNIRTCNTHYFCGADRSTWLNNTQNALFLYHNNNGCPNAPERYFIRTQLMLLICNDPCGSGLQIQETEPVQIHYKQLHSHTSYVCQLTTLESYLCRICLNIIWNVISQRAWNFGVRKSSLLCEWENAQTEFTYQLFSWISSIIPYMMPSIWLYS